MLGGQIKKDGAEECGQRGEGGRIDSYYTRTMLFVDVILN